MSLKAIHVKDRILNRFIGENISGYSDRAGLLGTGKTVTILSRDVVSG
jgi:hypothetical protein